MARTIGRLTALKVDRAKRPGMYADGGGLYLRVTGNGTKNWVFRFMLNGRTRWMGMGPLHTVGLAEARSRAAGFRLQRHDGVDPIEARRAERLETHLKAAKVMTFKECSARYIASHRAGWRNPKHAAQWEATLATYAEPVMGELSVQAIDTALVLKVLEPIWTTKPETAGRVRGRIESILDWAKVRGYRAGENPARWRGHLDKLLPARSKVRKVEHHAALPYAELPGFLAELARAGGHRGPRARIRHPDGRQNRRGDRRALGRNRPARKDLDAPGWAHEGRQGTPRSAIRSRARHLGRDAAASSGRGRLRVPRSQARPAALEHGVPDAVASHGPG